MTPAVDAASVHDRFLVLLPHIHRYARAYFRYMSCPGRRDDAVAEVVGLTWAWFLRLLGQGKDPAGFFLTLANFACRQVRCGRGLCGSEAGKDVHSRLARSRHGFCVESLPAHTRAGHERLSRPGGQRDQDLWEEALRDNTVTPPPEQASFRLDFPRWMLTLGERRRRIAEELLVGERTIDVAARYGISPARVSQLRSELCQDWRRFHGEPYIV